MQYTANERSLPSTSFSHFLPTLNRRKGNTFFATNNKNATILPNPQAQLSEILSKCRIEMLCYW